MKPKIIELDAAVIGSGAAAYNAADWLYDYGKRGIAIITEGRNAGTSRNTGSDKQTYYKLSLCSDAPDSVREMAKTLYDGGCVDGDVALCEAAGSVQSFMKLVQLGVPFPANRYGEYAGYKTDHDPRQRATSAGPLTSRYMTEALERQVAQKNIKIYDGYYCAELLVKDGAIVGALALNTGAAGKIEPVLFRTRSAVLATGGPAGIYADSVYPESQTGSSGLAIAAGAEMCNLQEWQYGLASTKFRWNVSGTYQQVLPRYISVDKDGNEREFLLERYKDPYEAGYMVFLKGYQWPFDSAKRHGSSEIDMLVYEETIVKGNRVFMDFTKDPAGICSETLKNLPEEAYAYLSKSGALIDTPIARLKKMNPKAIELYRSHGIDLEREPLEIGVCAQHSNGGAAVDMHWQSSVEGLYVAGEAAGTFGVYRPGGAALNSTQVGSMRAAEEIAFGKHPERKLPDDGFYFAAAEKLEEELRSARGKTSNIAEKRRHMQRMMSRVAAFLRDVPAMEQYLSELYGEWADFYKKTSFSDSFEAVELLKNRDILLTQIAVLESMIESAKTAGSRGSCLVYDEKGGIAEEDKSWRGRILRVGMREGKIEKRFVGCRPIPENDDWFENVWGEFNERREK